jgi:sporulation protein YlmC with PRC-barrel domain
MKTNSILVTLTVMTCSAWASAQEAPAVKASPKAVSKATLWSVNDSIGSNVVNAKGEDLGDVEDIVLDRNKSRIAYVIVSYGGVLGLGDKHFAVPWQAFGQTDDRELSLAIDPEQLKSAPGFEKGILPNTSDPLFHESVYSFYNTKPYSLEQKKKARADAQATQEKVDDSAFDWAGWVNRGEDTTWARRLGEVIGTNIENAQGEAIAELEDVIVDSREARAGYAVVSFGGTLGYFADTAIIPWNALRLDLTRDAYVTDATLAQLERAKLSDTEYRNLEDMNYSQALYGNFHTQPYWEEFGYETEMAETDRKAELKASSDDTADAAEDTANELYPNAVTGTIVTVSSYGGVTPETQSQRGVRIRVRSSSGAVRTVHLDTNEESQRQELMLKRGDKVAITGEQMDYRGHKVLYAREVQKDGKTIKFEK